MEEQPRTDQPGQKTIRQIHHQHSQLSCSALLQEQRYCANRHRVIANWNVFCFFLNKTKKKKKKKRQETKILLTWSRSNKKIGHFNTGFSCGHCSHKPPPRRWRIQPSRAQRGASVKPTSKKSSVVVENGQGHDGDRSVVQNRWWRVELIGPNCTAHIVTNNARKHRIRKSEKDRKKNKKRTFLSAYELNKEKELVVLCVELTPTE